MEEGGFLFLAEAIRLHDMGFSVIPLVSNQKRPAIDWEKYQEQRATLDEIRNWWQAPGFGLGVVTGEISQDVALDFDPKKGSTVDDLIEEAELYFSKQLNRRVEFPKTCRVITAGDAYHDHFTCEVPVATAYIFKGLHGDIQIRADGAIIVMPPTIAASKRNDGEGLGDYAYLTDITDRIPWESTWLVNAKAILPRQLNPVTTDRPATSEINRSVMTTYGKLSNYGKKILAGDLKPEDRSGQSYKLACEAVRSDVLDPHDIACLVMMYPYHQEKYLSRKPGEDWHDAMMCAYRALTELGYGEKPPTATKLELPRSKFRAIPLRDIVPQKPKFLIDPYLPIGEITLLDGDPGAGKSFIWMGLAAGLTGSTVCRVPFDYTAPQDAAVLILTTEDDPHNTIVQRLDELGANLDKIFIVGPDQELTDYHDVQGINVADLEHVYPIMEEIKPNLVVIDPLVLFVSSGGSFDTNNSSHVRDMFTKIKALARRTECAVLVVRHLRKQGSNKAIYRGSGSIDHIAAARSVLFAAEYPTTKQKMVSHAKSNLAKNGPSLNYELSEGVPIFKWTGIAQDITADMLLGEQSALEDHRDMQDAKNLLVENLKDGPISAEEIFKQAKDVHIDVASIKKAKNQLGILNRQTTSTSGKVSWVWELPDVKSEELETLLGGANE